MTPLWLLRLLDDLGFAVLHWGMDLQFLARRWLAWTGREINRKVVLSLKRQGRDRSDPWVH